MQSKSFFPALSLAVPLLCTGCASSGVAKLVTVDGKHLLAQACTEERQLEEAIADVEDRRRPLTEEISEVRKGLQRVDARLELSSIATRASDDRYRCSQDVTIPRERPAFALPEEEAYAWGMALCAVQEMGTAAACDEAAATLGRSLGFACEAWIQQAMGGDAEDLGEEFGVLFLQLLGDFELERGETGSGFMAHALAAVLEAHQFQTCAEKVAAASHTPYRIWSFERRYLGREAELVALCQEWQAEHTQLLDRLGRLKRRDRETERELATLREEYSEVRAEISRSDLRCP